MCLTVYVYLFVRFLCNIDLFLPNEFFGGALCLCFTPLTFSGDFIIILYKLLHFRLCVPG